MGAAHEVDGRDVLVTGANGGLGAAFVEALLARGVRHVHAAMRDVARMPARWAGEDRITPLPLDLTRPDMIAQAATLCRSMDIVIHNAGVTCIGPVSRHDAATARQVMEVNYFGPVQLSSLMAEELTSRQGGMIFILSMAAMIPPGPAPLYSASKAACAMYAAGVLADHGKRGLNVTLSFPGYIDTPMAGAFTSFKAGPSAIAERTLDAWQAGESHVFPDRFSALVLDYMRSDGARMLVDVDKVRAEIGAAYEAWSSGQPGQADAAPS